LQPSSAEQFSIPLYTWCIGASLFMFCVNQMISIIRRKLCQKFSRDTFMYMRLSPPLILFFVCIYCHILDGDLYRALFMSIKESKVEFEGTKVHNQSRFDCRIVVWYKESS
jgi:hypothetical protein